MINKKFAGTICVGQSGEAVQQVLASIMAVLKKNQYDNIL